MTLSQACNRTKSHLNDGTREPDRVRKLSRLQRV